MRKCSQKSFMEENYPLENCPHPPKKKKEKKRKLTPEKITSKGKRRDDNKID